MALFWFFEAANPEMLVKVINACSLNERFGVFYAGTHALTLTVTDTANGHVHTYQNADVTAAPPVRGTDALPCHRAAARHRRAEGGDRLRCIKAGGVIFL